MRNRFMFVPELGRLFCERVYLFYEEPQIFLCSTTFRSQYYLMLAVPAENGDAWLAVEVSSNRVQALEDNEVSIRDAVIKPEEGASCWLITNANEQYTAVKVDPKDMPDDFLPVAGECLDYNNTVIQEKKKLVRKYPFLLPSSETLETYDGGWNWLDDLEHGWNLAFGQLLCDDIAKELEESGDDSFHIIQIKEKWGSLHLYYTGGPASLHDIIESYSILSGHVCLGCGKVDVPQTYDGWVAPLCEKCYSRFYSEGTPERYQQAISNAAGHREKLQDRYPKVQWNRETEEEEQVGWYDIKSIVDRIDDEYKQ